MTPLETAEAAVFGPIVLLWQTDTEKARTRSLGELRRRWATLLAWRDRADGGPVGGPPRAISPVLLDAWRAFENKASGLSGLVSGPDAGEYGAAALDLNTAERNAQLQGFSSEDVPAMSGPIRNGEPVPRQVHVPTVESEHPVAGGIDDAAKKTPIPDLRDPYLSVKVAVLAGLGLGTFAGSLAAKEESARIGVAVCGTLVTLLSGLAMFLPSDTTPGTPKKEEKKA